MRLVVISLLLIFLSSCAVNLSQAGESSSNGGSLGSVASGNVAVAPHDEAPIVKNAAGVFVRQPVTAEQLSATVSLPRFTYLGASN